MILRAVLLASLLAAPPAQARWVRATQSTVVPDYHCAWAAEPMPCHPRTIRYSEWRWRL